MLSSAPLDMDSMARAVIIKRNITSSETTCGYIVAAVSKAHGDALKADMLTVKEFRTASGMSVDALWVDRFYNNIKHDMPIFISDAMIEWMGFEGGKDNDMTVKRKHFLKTLKRCDPSGNNHQTFSFDELSKYQCDLSPLSTKTPRGPTHSGDKSNSDEHAQLPGPSESDIKSMYPTIEKDRDTSRRKYVMVDTDLFQKILMRLDTSKGDHVLTIPYAQGAINLWHEVRESFRGAAFVGTTCTLNTGTKVADLVAAIEAAEDRRRVI
jgi:hypothetical protein